MGMKKGDKIDKWIDLSLLPKNKRGQIDWKQSIGIETFFKYGDKIGKIKLLKYYKERKCDILIDIDNRIIPYCLHTTLIKNCSFGYAIKQPVGETHPELIKYFVNYEDVFKYSAYCTKCVDVICPTCGFKKHQSIGLLTASGFSCPRCSDGKSWAEKFMFNILEQLKVQFKNEVSKNDKGFEWAGRYRYDFYFKYKDKKILIEMDGHFHDGSNFHEYKDVHIVDVQKDDLALDNGFILIRIDCRYRNVYERFEYIKQNILNSDLCLFLNLSSVNWNLANEHALDSYIKRSADLFNMGIKSPSQIGKLLGISATSIRKYLKTATDIGWCTYTVINGKSITHVRPIALYKDNNMVGIFMNAYDLDKQSTEIYGVHMDYRNIHAACNGLNRHKRVAGYTPKYITYDEYQHLSLQFQATQNKHNVLQEVI